MDRASQLLNKLFGDEEIKTLERDTASVFSSLFVKKLKDTLGDDLFKLVVDLQNKEPEKAKELLKSKNVDMGKIFSDIVELISDDTTKKLLRSLDE